MKKYIILLMLLFVLFICSCKKSEVITYSVNDTLSSVTNKEAKVVLLYGQSNATGVASSNYLREKDIDEYEKCNEGFSNVWINYITEKGVNSSNNSFEQLKLGCGASKDYFGPEIGIAEQLRNTYKSDDIFIIKYSYGGSNLAKEWLDGYGKRGDLYNNAIAFTKASLDYLISKGYKLDILGICWMQGESDAYFNNMTKKYYDNTLNMIKFFRSDLKGYQKTIKFVDAYIAPIDLWTNHEKVNDAKLQISKLDNNYIVDSLDLKTDGEPVESPDIAHYDSLEMIKLGNRFGEKLI